MCMSLCGVMKISGEQVELAMEFQLNQIIHVEREFSGGNCPQKKKKLFCMQASMIRWPSPSESRPEFEAVWAPCLSQAHCA
mmetsp:Transcript_126613/g.218476  ORF Transcript_126613/g.218476 Transcript_126613/m.218476 type:complete len:81 (-) Transcript_126613:57-299(-)